MCVQPHIPAGVLSCSDQMHFWEAWLCVSKRTSDRQRILNVAAKKERESLNQTETRSETSLAFPDCYFTAKSCRNIFVYSPHPSPKKPSSAFCARKRKASRFSLRCLLPLLFHLSFFFKKPYTDCQLAFSSISFCCWFAV